MWAADQTFCSVPPLPCKNCWREDLTFFGCANLNHFFSCRPALKVTANIPKEARLHSNLCATKMDYFSKWSGICNRNAQHKQVFEEYQFFSAIFSQYARPSQTDFPLFCWLITFGLPSFSVSHMAILLLVLCEFSRALNSKRLWPSHRFCGGIRLCHNLLNTFNLPFRL